MKYFEGWVIFKPVLSFKFVFVLLIVWRLRQDVFSCFDLLIFLVFEGLFSWREEDPSSRKIVEGRWIILAPYCSVFDLHVPCSRLRDRGEKSFSKKKCEKRAVAGERQGVGACTHLFNGLFNGLSQLANQRVYQELIYPLIGQLWQLTSLPFFSPPPPPFPTRARLIFALVFLIRPHYTIWEPGTG